MKRADIPFDDMSGDLADSVKEFVDDIESRVNTIKERLEFRETVCSFEDISDLIRVVDEVKSELGELSSDLY